MPDARNYRFDQFLVDLRSASLRRDGVVLPLRPKSFDLLVHLVRNPNRLVTKDELIEKLWPGVIVTENSVAQCIREVRQVLGDEAQATIRTVARRGYLFAPSVVETTDAPPARDPAQSAPPLPERPSIAVLPFDNMSGDPDQEHIADGLSEDLITGLSRIHWLFVIARNSTFVYKHRAVDVKLVSRELGVRYVLEGSVQRSANRLRISAQLIDAVSGGHHWAERYDRELGDIFAVQDEITRSVAAIEPELLAAEGIRALARSPADLGAWELVAQAQTHVWRMSQTDFAAAIVPLERAVRLWPDYAPARSLLAFCLAFSRHMGWVVVAPGAPPVEPPVREHVLRAIALDERDPWAHIALGYLSLMERHPEEAIAAFSRAVALNPNSASAHAHLSHGLAFSGQSGPAIVHGEEAIRLSPLDPMMALWLGGIAVAHYMAGRYEEAYRYTSRAVRLRPGFQGALRLCCACLAQLGRNAEAGASLAAARSAQPGLSLAWIVAHVPYQTPELMERFLDGMRKAGLR